ncbi:GNAT family N-acetyltransferase [Chryseobacterium sp.]|uniref:GNAT family N-acetyltransferase n=1 Tax=Chryseobacterium sp. TaxID=1871047 RepID=UPI0025C34754|nr:GNAT family N-acetyltransferase [Chryseobacterium sp.]
MEIITIDRKHFPQIAKIYQEGIDTGNATFETTVPSWEIWNKSKLSYCRLIVVENEIVIGWAALSKVSERSVYEGVAELSIYIAENHRGKGIGKILMQKLVKESETKGIWTLQSAMFPENLATLSLHKTFGFRVIGYREKIGKLAGVWRDSILMERRSKITGIN